MADIETPTQIIDGCEARAQHYRTTYGIDNPAAMEAAADLHHLGQAIARIAMTGASRVDPHVSHIDIWGTTT